MNKDNDVLESPDGDDQALVTDIDKSFACSLVNMVANHLKGSEEIISIRKNLVLSIASEVTLQIQDNIDSIIINRQEQDKLKSHMKDKDELIIQLEQMVYELQSLLRDKHDELEHLQEELRSKSSPTAESMVVPTPIITKASFVGNKSN
jgi:hypothetical protein